MKRLLLCADVTIPLWRAEKTVSSDGMCSSWKTVRIGSRTAVVELHVDLELLIATLGQQALGNKSRTASLNSGTIQCVVRKGTEQNEEESCSDGPVIPTVVPYFNLSARR